MNPKCNRLAYSPAYYDMVYEVAKSQYKRRKRDFNELAILSSQDLGQELWCSLLGREVSGQLLDIFIKELPDFKEYLISLAEIIVRYERRKSKDGHVSPISDFQEPEREKLENLYYCY